MLSDEGPKIFKLCYETDFNNSPSGDYVSIYNEWMANGIKQQLDTFEVVLPDGGKIKIVDHSFSADQRRPPNYYTNNKQTMKVNLDVKFVRLDKNNNIVQSYDKYKIAHIPTMVGSAYDPSVAKAPKTSKEAIELKREMMEPLRGPEGYFIYRGNESQVLMRDCMRHNMPFVFHDYKGDLQSKYTMLLPGATKLVVLNFDTDELGPLKLTLDFMTDQDKSKAAKRWVDVGYVLEVLGNKIGIKKSQIPDYVADFAKRKEIIKDYAQRSSLNVGGDVFERLQESNYYKNNVEKQIEDIEGLSDEDIEEMVKNIIDEKIITDLYEHLDLVLKPGQVFVNNDNRFDENGTKDFYYICKFQTLCYQTCLFMEVLLELSTPDDRNDWMNKKITTPTFMISKWLNKLLKKLKSSINIGLSLAKTKGIKGTVDNIIIGRINSFSNENSIDDIIAKVNVSDNNDKYDDANTERLLRDSVFTPLDHTTRIKSAVSGRTDYTVRQVTMSQAGYVCLIRTPDSENCGIVKHKAISCKLSKDNYVEFLHPLIFLQKVNQHYDNRILKDTYMLTIQDKSNLDNIYLNLNGMIVGRVPTKYFDTFKTMKQRGIENYGLPHDSCIFMDRTLEIFTDDSRPTRPLIKLQQGYIDILNEQTTDMEEWKSLKEYMRRDDKGYKIISKSIYDTTEWNFLTENGYIQLRKVFAPIIQEKAYETKNWKELLEEGYIEMIDAREQSKLFVAMSKDDIEFNNEYNEKLMSYAENLLGIDKDTFISRMNSMRIQKATHAEIDPILILGISGVHIPYINHMQAPRAVYQANMLSQSETVRPPEAVTSTQSAEKYLSNPSMPIVRTAYEDLMGVTLTGAGQTAVVAVMPFEGLNQEDSFVMNKASIQKGYFNYDVYHTESYTLKSGEGERLGLAAIKDEIFISRNKFKPQYHALIDNIGGELVLFDHPLIGSKINEGDVIIPITAGDPPRDESIRASIDMIGIVDSVRVLPADNSNITMIVKVRQHRYPGEGDKFALRQAQKATLTRVIDDVDMPFFRDGTRPDAIINPLCIPSRMTMATPMEILTGASTLYSGFKYDPTGFRPIDYVELIRSLVMAGYTPKGTRKLRDGKTGEVIQSFIMIGPAFIQKLKHDTRDKRKVRAFHGSTDELGQPKKDRKTRGGGGMRFGEMEAFASMGHGASGFVWDSLGARSDRKRSIRCKKCGDIALPGISGDKPFCKSCKSFDVVTVYVAGTFQYYADLMETSGITMRFKYEAYSPYDFKSPFVADYENLVKYQKGDEVDSGRRLYVNNKVIEVFSNKFRETFGIEFKYNIMQLIELQNSGKVKCSVKDSVMSCSDYIYINDIVNYIMPPTLIKDKRTDKQRVAILEPKLAEYAKKFQSQDILDNALNVLNAVDIPIEVATVDGYAKEIIKYSVKTIEVNIKDKIKSLINESIKIINKEIKKDNNIVAISSTATHNGNFKLSVSTSKVIIHPITMSTLYERYKNPSGMCTINRLEEDKECVSFTPEFSQSIHSLVGRYFCILNKELDNSFGFSLNMSTVLKFTELFGCNIQAFTTPFNISLPYYTSFFNEDREFGSLGTFADINIKSGCVLGVLPSLDSFIAEVFEKITKELKESVQPLRYVLMIENSPEIQNIYLYTESPYTIEIAYTSPRSVKLTTGLEINDKDGYISPYSYAVIMMQNTQARNIWSTEEGIIRDNIVSLFE